MEMLILVWVQADEHRLHPVNRNCSINFWSGSDLLRRDCFEKSNLSEVELKTIVPIA